MRCKVYYQIFSNLDGSYAHQVEVLLPNSAWIVAYKAYDEPQDTGTIRYYYRNKDSFAERRLISNLAVLSDEEFFQTSLVWEEDVDIFVLKAVQDTFSRSFPFEKVNHSWYQEFNTHQ
jgi:hypothetical protein